jgi:NADH-quinone oxidoreductase subunit K
MFITLTLAHVLTFTSLLLVVAMVGIVLNRKNVIVILMCLELLLLAAEINLVGAGYFRSDLQGQILTFFILTVAAAELAIGLAIVTLFYRNRGSIEVDAADLMKG